MGLGERLLFDRKKRLREHIPSFGGAWGGCGWLGERLLFDRKKRLGEHIPSFGGAWGGFLLPY